MTGSFTAEAADTDRVRAFLDAHYERGVSGVAVVGQGDWSIAYAFQHNGADYVVRFGQHREDFEKDRLAAAYRSAALPIPRVIEIGEAFGGFFAISDRVYGRYLDSLDETEMRAVLPGLFATLDAARLADVSGSTGYGGWDATGDAPHATWTEALHYVGDDLPTKRPHGWREKMAASRLGAGPFDEAFACLRDLVAQCPTDRHLIHNDLLNRNVLVQGATISGVIDWGCAMYGDFVYDVALLAYSPFWFPEWRHIDFAGEAQRHYETIDLDVPGFAMRLRCYKLHVGLDSAAYQAFRGRNDELEATLRELIVLTG